MVSKSTTELSTVRTAGGTKHKIDVRPSSKVRIIMTIMTN